MNLNSLTDIQLLRESLDIECKLALGEDGRGALPRDFWPTYSAFANTEGGVVLLGLREKHGTFVLEGIQDVAKVRKELFDGLNNRQKVSANLLNDHAVKEFVIDGKTLLAVKIPRATRTQRPVFLSTNPLDGHTYRRSNDGDRRVPDVEVKRMLAEQVEDSRDDRILQGYDFDDMSMETFRAYRQVFANREPAHPWNALDDIEFLKQLGGWRKDRHTGESGLTLAGLLMFGWMRTLQEALPNYMLDYQEQVEAGADRRWIDRLTLDGKWSGNLYDFYRKVYLKLTADLKVPFALEKGERKDETPVHVALREALANVLVHADYSDRASVLVVKRPDMFVFRNPGLMRVPPEIAIRGGEHDCRNRTLHKMFRLVGVGEQAGSGIPKIYGGWAGQHWRPPALYEKREPFEQTLMELRMVDLMPEAVLEGLRQRFGDRLDAVSREGRLVLAAAASEQTVTHARVIELTGLHAGEATRLLRGLVRDDMLEAHNHGRGAVYCLPGAGLPRPEEVFGASSEHLAESSEHLTRRSEHLPVHSEHLAAPGVSDGGQLSNENQRDSNGRLISPHLDAPMVDDLEALSTSHLHELIQAADRARTMGKLPRDEMESILLALCKDQYVTRSCLADLVQRDANALRQQYLSRLVAAERLKLAFPTAPTHHRQAYRTR
ncbi:MAG: putative DNA binding domain-containing protein [Aquimonas sp.]|nr:putative DNA binding domain-containing protein [Aquimonas sp.]